MIHHKLPAAGRPSTTNHKLIYLCAVKKKKQPIVLVKILVEDHAGEGRSLARVEGKVIFIEDAVPGSARLNYLPFPPSLAPPPTGITGIRWNILSLPKDLFLLLNMKKK